MDPKYLNKRVWAMYPEERKKAPAILVYHDRTKNHFVFWCAVHRRGFIAPEFKPMEGVNYGE